jgi:hypothetical protein
MLTRTCADVIALIGSSSPGGNTVDVANSKFAACMTAEG